MPEPECEFLSVCNSEGGFGCGMGDKRNCGLRRTFDLLLNSPQFKKQYAEREELVEAILERRHHGHSYDVIHFNEVAKIIKNHGLEE